MPMLMRRGMGPARGAVVVRGLGPAAVEEEAAKREGRVGRWGGTRGDWERKRRFG